MNKSQVIKCKLTAGLAGLLLIFAGSAPAQLTVTPAFLAGTANTYPFTPSWTPAADSLLLNVNPSTVGAGNFTQEIAGRNPNTLTQGGSLTINKTSGTTSINYVTCGTSGGQSLIYTLPATNNGYNITNVTVFGGWADSGRDAQGYTVWYSTVANPANFIELAAVNYSPAGPGSTPTSTRVVINDAAGAVIAANVAQIKFDFTFPVPPNGQYNGYVGYAGITVEGAAAPTPPLFTITTQTQQGSSVPFTPTWTLETNSLIANELPSATTGNFGYEDTNCNVDTLTQGGSLTIDSTNGNAGDSINSPTTSINYVTCGGRNGTGSTIIYPLTNSPFGSDITNIVVYNGWKDTGRDGQYYIVSYSKVAAPNTFIPITTVNYLPSGPSEPTANRVSISASSSAPIATGAAAVKFDFASPYNSVNFNNGFQGYAQIVVQGTNTATPPPPPSPLLTQDTLPGYAATIVGDKISFTASYSNTPPASVQWLEFGGGVTNVISTGVVTVTNGGVVTSTVTLNNLQVTNSAYYTLEALNATNGAAAPSFSTAAQLVVNSTPAPQGNIIMYYAEQDGQGALSAVNTSTNFTPTWSVNTNNDLILGSINGSGPGTFVQGTGNFDENVPNFGAGPGPCSPDPTILSDGTGGYLTYWVNIGGNTTQCSCGTGGTGDTMTYTLPTAPYGFDVTNITVYGGWGDHGRNEQKYQILYSTASAPSTFLSLGTFDFNPNDPNNTQSATRTMLVPVSGALAKNVVAVEINWNVTTGPKNNWEGYSEIVVAGTASPNVPVLTTDIAPETAEDVVGSSLTLTASFSGATSYQWFKDGAPLSGASSATLTLSNLQLSDTATNGGYKLVALNSSGTNVSAACAVVIDPAPVAVNNVVTAFAYQTSAALGFGPTWDTTALTSPANLISVSSIVDDLGDFTGGSDQALGLQALNDGSYGVFASDGTHPAFATGGGGAGDFVTYTLGSNPNGYDVTNIQIAGGWNDNGRDSQYYTIAYSTVENPTMFVPLVTAQNNLLNYGVGDETAVRGTFTPATGVLASNVYAVEIDFTVPPGVPNGYSGYSEISVFGSPSATAPPAGPVITTQHEEVTDSFTVETPNLIANQLPSMQGPGVFTEEGCNVTNLTDGVIGFGFQYGASCGDDGVAVPWIIFDSSTGWDLTNIVTYTLWHDYGRDGQYYNVSYSTLSAPTTFVPLASVAYNPFVAHDGTASGNRVAIAPPVGQSILASNVYAVKFDFTPQGIQDFGWSGYSEIVLQGSSLPAPTAPIISSSGTVGGNLVVTGTGGSPYYGFALLTSTNLTTPLSSWTISTNGELDGSGAFTIAIPINATNAASFFRLKME